MNDAPDQKPMGNLTMEQQRVQFATKLENMRADRGWTQTELARRASVHTDKEITRDRISKYAGGKSLPGRPHLVAIAKALNVAPEELLPTRASRVALANSPLQATLRSDGMAQLNINMAVPWDTAVEILKMIREAGGGPTQA